jgi:two-component system response regulator AlgR
MKILIADDEPLARTRLAGFVRAVTSSDLVTEAADGKEALSAVELDQPDIVLLDIRMPGLDGLDLARKLNSLRNPPVVIFTTAYDSHALQAYEVQAIDYLLKPVRRERLALALARAKGIARMKQPLKNHEAPRSVSQRTQISASWQGTLHVIPIAQIRYFLAEHKYVTVRYPQGMVLIEESLASLADEFKDRFLRVHRCALVAIAHIQGIDRHPVGRHYVRLSGIDERIQVSRRLNATVRKTLKGMNTIKKPPQ